MSQNGEYQYDFKTNNPLEKRKDEVKRINKKYPTRIPVICEPHKRSRNSFKLDKRKYLVPHDMPLGSFVCVLRKRLRLSSVDAIYLFVNGTLAQSHETMGSIHHNNVDEDGFLYILVSPEKTFG